VAIVENCSINRTKTHGSGDCLGFAPNSLLRFWP